MYIKGKLETLADSLKYTYIPVIKLEQYLQSDWALIYIKNTVVQQSEGLHHRNVDHLSVCFL